jgi:hypothetical protein
VAHALQGRIHEASVTEVLEASEAQPGIGCHLRRCSNVEVVDELRN